MSVQLIQARFSFRHFLYAFLFMVGIETFLKRLKSGERDSLKSRGLKLKIVLTSNKKVSVIFEKHMMCT